MGYRNSICIIIMVGLISSSCEKIIDINVPDRERKIVLNSVIDPENVLSIRLTQSKSILEDNNILILENADVLVYEDDMLVGEMEYLNHDLYRLPGFYPGIGKTYRLEVDHPVLNHIQAETMIPRPVNIIDIDTSTSIGDWEQKIYNMNITIDDPSAARDYYAVSIALTINIFDWQNQGLTDSTETFYTYISTPGESDDGIGDEFMDNNLSFFIDDKLFFSDEVFSGQGNARELALEYYIFSSQDSVSVDVSLYHIDPSYYFYSVSREKYYRADGNPFAEPVRVYCNIKNGLGLLSSFSRTNRKFNIYVEGDR